MILNIHFHLKNHVYLGGLKLQIKANPNKLFIVYFWRDIIIILILHISTILWNKQKNKI